MRNHHPTLRSSKLKKRRRKIFAVKFIGILLLLIAVAFLLSWASKMSAIQIAEIQVSGNVTISKDEIMGFAKKEMSGKYLILFSKNNIFLYPKKIIKEKILNDFKKVEKVKINSKGLKTIELGIVERKPSFMWCSGDEKVATSSSGYLGSCYFTDKEGLIFSSAPDFSGDGFVRYYGLIDGVNPIGEIYMTGGKFKDAVDFVNSLKDLGIITAKFYAESENNYKIYLKNGIKIIFDDRQSFDKILENIESVSGEIDFKSDYSADNPSKYDTADFRFGNKVFLGKG